MSRFEREFASAGEASVSSELLDLLATYSASLSRERREAIACYLSASDGWDEAMKALGGTFAVEAATAMRVNAVGYNKQDINQRASEYLQWQALKPADSDND